MTMSVFDTPMCIGKATLRVLRGRPRLVLFPLLAVAGNLTLLLMLFPDLDRPWDGMTLALLYFLGHGVASFFSAGLTCEALRALRGQPISLAGGLGCAASRLGAIAAYAVIESTVGLVLRAVERIGPRPVGSWLKMLLGDTWSLLSYLALPVLIAERRGGYDSLRRSSELMRRTWCHTAVSEFGVRLLGTHLVVVLIGICLLLARVIKDPFALAVVIGLFLASVMVVATLHAIYRAALYIFAAEGAVPDEFDTPEIHAVWRV
jgi:Family of unknown function (DUF6159)